MANIIKFLLRYNKLAIFTFILISALFSVLIWNRIDDYYDTLNQKKFENHVNVSIEKIEAHLLRCGDVLATGVSFLNASNDVTKQDWHNFVQGLNITHHYPGMQGFGFSVMLTPDEVAVMEQKMRAYGSSDFTLKPPGVREEYSTIMYLEPMDKRNQKAIGYDMYSNPIRKKAMATARDSGTLTLSGKVTLVQEIDTNKQAGMLLYAPYYQKNTDMNNLQERQKGLIGFVYSPFRMDDLMLSTGAHTDDIDFKLYDSSNLSDDSLMYNSAKDTSYTSKHTLQKSLTLYNHTWYLLFSSSEAFDTANDNQYALWLTAASLAAYFALIGIIVALLKSRYLLQEQKQQLQTLQAEIIEHSHVLKESETKYRSLIENIPGIAYRCKLDKDWTMLFMSKEVDAITGYSSDDLLVNKVTSYGALILPEDSGYVEDSVIKAVENNEVWEIEYRIKHKDGSIRHVYEKGRAIFDHNGYVEYLDGFLLDVTQQKSMANALRESNERFQVLFDASPDPTWIIHDHVFVECNQAAIDILGYPNKDSLMKAHPSDLSPEFQPDGEYSYSKAEKMMLIAMEKKVHRFEWVHRRWDKSDFFAEVTLSSITLQRKKVLACTWRDISERKEAEAIIQKSEAKYRALFELTNDAMMTLDENGFINCNKATLTMFGVSTVEEFCRYHPKDLSPEKQNCGTNSSILADKYIQNTYKNGVERFEWIHQRLDNGELFFADVSLNVVNFNNKRILQAAVRNISERKHIEFELMEAKKAAEASARSKSEFLAAMSHEIRTPMNGVLGMLSLLEHSTLDDLQHHQLHIAIFSATSLLGLINDILDFSKIEAGKMDLEILEFDLNNELHDLVESLLHKAHEKGLNLTLDTTKITYPNIITDPSRLRQILTNLIGNSIKFTHEGGVHISASMVSQTDTHGRLHIDVSDTGIGIPSEKIPILFEPFTQADGSTTRKYGGTGLGLSIVKNLCALMDGTISVMSVQNEGSTFSIDLNVKLGNDQLITQETKQEISEKNIVWPVNNRILLVEDNTTNQLVAQGILESLGLTCDIASNGLEALDAIRLSSNVVPYTLLIMDCQMPEMDGYDATRAIRAGEAGEENKQIPIIAMTANAMQGDRQKCTDAGMNDYIAKPINLSILRSALIKWILKKEISVPLNSDAFQTEQTTVQADLPLWDEADALNRLGSNSTLLNKIIQSFTKDAPKSLSALRTALDDNNNEDAQLHAHSLKGSAGNVGALKLQVISKHLEEAAKNKNLTEIRARLEEAENTLNETLKVFEIHLAKEVKPTDRKKRFDPLQMAINLQVLKKELENGIVINTEISRIFVEYTDEAFTQKMATLKEHIERSEHEYAMHLIEEIIEGLN